MAMGVYHWGRVYPRITDCFIGPAKPISVLRDELHIAWGGTFVDKRSCPDECDPADCKHYGEPLNANGKRERTSGPNRRQPTRISSAANFGGLVRMLKTASPEARLVFRTLRSRDDWAHKYISFIHKNFHTEEFNQYTIEEWRIVAGQIGVPTRRTKNQIL